MKQIINLDRSSLDNLSNELFINANSLKKDSEVLFSVRNSISSANSLLILSSEEIIKAILVLMYKEGYEVHKMKEANKFFKDHKIRHQIAKIVDLTISLFEAGEIWEKKRNNPRFKSKYKLLNVIGNFILDIGDTLEPIANSNDRIKKLEKFNDDKNKGFYVDFRNEIISPQYNKDKSTYEENLIIVERLLRFFKAFRLINNPKVKERYQKEFLEIEEMLKHTKKIINENIKDFSLKELESLK